MSSEAEMDDTMLALNPEVGLSTMINIFKGLLRPLKTFERVKCMIAYRLLVAFWLTLSLVSMA